MKSFRAFRRCQNDPMQVNKLPSARLHPRMNRPPSNPIPNTQARPLSTMPAPTAITTNNLVSLASQGKICTSFGLKICRGVEIVHIAKASGYDSLFIDLEHTCMTLKDASQICITAISAGITPFVRVPHECGVGFIQKALDVGAMGVIIPHIHGVGMFSLKYRILS